MSTSPSEIALWIVVALFVGILLGGSIVWAIVDDPAADCSVQDTAGNWQPACVQGR